MSFIPPPEKDKKYITKDGDILVVSDVFNGNSLIPAFVEFKDSTDNDECYEEHQWNNLECKEDNNKNNSSTPPSPQHPRTPQYSTDFEKLENTENNNSESNNDIKDNDIVDSDDEESSQETSNTDTSNGGSNDEEPSQETSNTDASNGGSNDEEHSQETSNTDTNNGGTNNSEPLQEPIAPDEVLRGETDKEQIDKLSKLFSGRTSDTLPVEIPNDIIAFTIKDTSKLEDNISVTENDIIKELESQINTVNKLREEGKTKRSNFLNEFFWSCEGVDKALLRSCPRDYTRYATSGAVILGTALTAMLSGGFAFNTIITTSMSEYSIYATIAFAIFWGLIIFNIDRFIVNSMYSDGKASISKKELMSGLPRIVMAIFLGIIISTPLEMYIFGDKITEHIDNKEYSSVKSRGIEKKIEDTRGNIIEIGRKYEAQYKKKEAYKDSAIIEVTQRGGPGVKSALHTSNSNKADSLANIHNAELGILKTKLDSLNVKKDKITEESRNNCDGFTTKYRAYSEITAVSWDDRKNLDLFLARLLISLFIIIIELLPVFTKMMFTNGKYDEMLEMELSAIQKIRKVKEARYTNLVHKGKFSADGLDILGVKPSDFDNKSIDIKEGDANLSDEKRNFALENKIITDVANQQLVKCYVDKIKALFISLIEGKQVV